MMSRARIPDALLALLAVAAVVAPIRTLFSPDSWIPLALVMAVAVTVTGVVVRALTRRDVPVVLWQIGVGVALICWIFVREHLWYGLPRWETVLALNDLLYAARVTITTYAPPAPTGPGVILALALLVWLTTLVVDFFAVTRGSPTLAGIPLLVAFLVSASNSGRGMPIWYFLAAALVWLALLGRSGVFSLTRWDAGSGGTMTAAPRRRRGSTSLAASGRQVGVAAILIAAVVATLAPHMPTRFLLDGLGRASGSVGGGNSMTISSTVNLAQSLQSQSLEPIITFSTTANAPAPMRVGVLPRYADGVWTLDEQRAESTDLPGSAASEDAVVETVEVTANALGAPQIALPFPASSLTIDSPWRTRTDGTVVVDRRVEEYTATYTVETPEEGELLAADPWPEPVEGSISSDDLIPDPMSSAIVGQVLEQIITPEMRPIEKARAIQSHLRSTRYTYSLDLVEPTDDNGDVIATDPITAFLLTRQGFCTQFTAAMVMMARTEGIPARFAIGFLPGTAGSDGTRTIVGADAHAWPELFFEGVGWLRFEPTPATRSGTGTPRYSRESTASPVPDVTAGPTAPAAPVLPFEPPEPQQTSPGGTTTPTTTLSELIVRYAWVGLVLLVAFLGAATMPLTAWWERRRRRRAAADEAARVEVIWQDLLERLDDVGVTPPPDASPRQTGRFIGGHSFLSQESKGALTRVISAVEASRYARPVDTVDPERIPGLEKDAHSVAEGVVGVLSRTDRVRSTWWPAAGVTAWRRRLTDLRTRLDRLPRR